jgi:hypothetical protein
MSADGGSNYKYRRRPDPHIGDKEVALLKDLVEDEGLRKVCEWVGVSEITLLRVMAGFSHKCQPTRLNKVRRFFAEAEI